jgi:hypothetical protein
MKFRCIFVGEHDDGGRERCGGCDKQWMGVSNTRKPLVFSVFLYCHCFVVDFGSGTDLSVLSVENNLRWQFFLNAI